MPQTSNKITWNAQKITWNAPNRFFVEKDDTGQVLSVWGTYYALNLIEMRFSLNLQNPEKSIYAYRGTLSIFDRLDGTVMHAAGKRKRVTIKKRMDHIKKAHDELMVNDSNVPPMTQDELKTAAESRPVLATMQLHTNQHTPAAIKEYIEDSISKLYTRHVVRIHHSMEKVIDRNTITPLCALELYGADFWNSKHPTHTEKTPATMDSTTDKYLNPVRNFLSTLPDKPMAEFTTTEILTQIQTFPIEKPLQARLRNFWSYCLDRGLCTGINPIPSNKKGHTSTHLQKRANTAEVLPTAVKLKLDSLLYDLADGPSCGVALQRSGFSPADILMFTWGDVEFDDRDDYAYILYLRTDNAGATHNYSRPLIPTSAMTLRKAYQKLRAKYSKTMLNRLPIVSKNGDINNAMTRDSFVRYSRTKLIESGLSKDVISLIRQSHLGDPQVAISDRILQRTYENDLFVICGLKDDPETAEFLLGHSLVNTVTFDRYVSFVSPSSRERLYTILHVLRPAENIIPPISPVALPDGTEMFVAAPSNTAHLAGACITITLLPGQTFSIASPHGVEGIIVPKDTPLTQNHTLESEQACIQLDPATPE